MIYNLERTNKKILAIVVAVLLFLGMPSSEILAFHAVAAEPANEESSLLLEASFTDGGCFEVVLGASRAVCGALATLSYDPELLSFLTFVKSDALDRQVTVSCHDLGEGLRILVDAVGGFDGVWCRLFFSINDKADQRDLLSEIGLLVESAYERTETGYGEICFDSVKMQLDLSKGLDSEQSEAESLDFVRIDLGGAFEKYCMTRISGSTDVRMIAAGFEITVSCENVTESYIALRVLPLEEGNGAEYAVIVPLPMRDSFYVTVREIGYYGKTAVIEEKKYSFFVLGSSVERVG